MNAAQTRLILAAAASLAAMCLWVWSFAYYPHGGLLRSALLFGVFYLAWSPFDAGYRAVSQQYPLNRNAAYVVFFVWLLVLLSVILVAQSRGVRDVTTGSSQADAFVFSAPVWAFLGVRAVQLYRYYGRAGT